MKLKKRYWLFSFLTLIAASAWSIEYRISPEQTRSAHLEQEARIQKLELAVEELQIKVFNLQSNSGNRNRYFCKAMLFTKEYKAFGLTQREAKEKIKADCMKDNNKIHCTDSIIHCEID